ncbi:citrate (Si)-synthase [Lentimicrobium sp.]|jgi:citrate synthase|uniref:citrate (Si)-synthase n=1 Tax=Lentimicrobium sp. TaxID=2034841 RepID=UPI0025FDD001|nr:citrate (Si)-synthase [Lentimicrobium sp.]MCO5255480.1 citrate (Si)-synthase [Lentimicrobium sp.]MCO5263088.1 citrate (Si)-synthase [Lentimicrobium sp.]HOP12364.1 citrate (Si)-synthase [Lentimicrobium sp.]HPF64065.1 citrate (Si)-synthase [Lentimicrobium sp.]HPJ61902.1 citrate (Si)-synthase [Lentimicrobium sp.]
MAKRLKDTLYEKIMDWRPRTERLMKEYGNVVVDKVTIGQILGGMRGIKSLVSDISYLDPQEGIRYRGYTLPEVFEKLPKARGGEMPMVEGLFYLLLTGDMPTEEQAAEVADEFNKRRILPRFIYELIDAMPCCSHPMTIFSTAILTLHRESFFTKKYHAGINKLDYWDPTYEDSLNLLAKLPEIATYTYAKLYRDGKRIQSNPNLDFGGNFAHMMGIGKPYDDVSRMHFIVHADHEAGNVSAHTGHLVASSLSDVYLSISAMVNGLAGPLHGLANQEVLRWLQDLMDKMNGAVPTEDELKQFVWNTLNSGQVIPGFGHAVLRKTDPRYMLQREFSLKNMPEDPLFKVVDMLYNVVPPILLEQGKAKNPWPNVDAQSGVIQWHYGIKEYDFYTVLFGIGRAIGICANIIWDRALGYPLERPKSLTTAILEDIAAGRNVEIED